MQFAQESRLTVQIGSSNRNVHERQSKRRLVSCTRSINSPLTRTEIGRTEVIDDTLNPRFIRSIVADYRFETNQYIKLVVIDIDDRTTSRLEVQELIGECQTTLAEIITSRGSIFTRAIVHPNMPNDRRGTVSVRSEEVSKIDAVVHFNIRASKLEKKDWFGSSGNKLCLFLLTITRSLLDHFTRNRKW
jgi:hypothetical protein